MTEYRLKITNAGNLQPGETATIKTITVADDCFITNYNPYETGNSSRRNITIDMSNGQTTITKGNSTYGTADFNKNIFSLVDEIANLHDDDGNSGDQTILSIEDIKKYEQLDGIRNDIITVAKDFANGVIRFIDTATNSTLLRIDFGNKNTKSSASGSASGSNSTSGSQTTTSQSSNTEKNTASTHTVVSGDTLSEIASDYNLFEWEVRRANPDIKNWRLIRPGQKINIPEASHLATWRNLSSTEQDFFNTLKARESGGEEYPYKTVAGSYLGAYQIGPDVLAKFNICKNGRWNPNNRFGITSKDDFFNSPEKQLQVVVASMQNNWDYLTVGNKEDGYNFDVRDYIGTEIEYRGRKYPITESGILAAAHLLGPYKVIAFLKNPQTTQKMTDGNGTHITEYLLMQGFDVSRMLNID